MFQFQCQNSDHRILGEYMRLERFSEVSPLYKICSREWSFFRYKLAKISSRGAAPHPAGLPPWTQTEAKGAAAPLETPAWGQAPRPPETHNQHLLANPARSRCL